MMFRPSGSAEVTIVVSDALSLSSSSLVFRCATSSSSFSIAVGNATCVFGDLSKGNGSTTSIFATTFPRWIVTLSPDGFSSWTGMHPSLGCITVLATATGSLPSDRCSNNHGPWQLSAEVVLAMTQHSVKGAKVTSSSMMTSTLLLAVVASTNRTLSPLICSTASAMFSLQANRRRKSRPRRACCTRFSTITTGWFAEHRKVKRYVVGLLGQIAPHFRKTRLKNWESKNSLHDCIKPFIGKKCDKIFVKKSSFFRSILPKHLLTAYFCNKQTSFRTLALSMTLFCHRRCHLTINDTTCNGNELLLDQPQKGRSSDKCETVNS
ncbi:hypothetical protein T06_1613 [Trichinella sp. T6]|nr:hypothetical protein T06_1613 [Trichinella sp. T6]